MFVYCLNNPVVYSDSTGTHAHIWPVLFQNHDPGYIHRLVQLHIIMVNSYQKELILPGIGRPDIYNLNTMELWEIKHGGSTAEMQASRILEADDQVTRYINRSKEKNIGFYRKGHAGAFTGGFILNYGNFSYSVMYHTPEEGVILYHVERMEHYVHETSYSYEPSSLKKKSRSGCTAMLVAGIGTAGLACISSLKPLCRTSPA